MNLTETARGFYLIQEVKGEEDVVTRLQDLGFVPGESIEILQVLPFGEPIIIRIRDQKIAIRKREALCVTV